LHPTDALDQQERSLNSPVADLLAILILLVLGEEEEEGPAFCVTGEAVAEDATASSPKEVG
jgi:hypothetical protein